MANIKSARKDIRRSAKRGQRNRQVCSRLKTLGKKVRKLVEQEDMSLFEPVSREYVSALDKAAKKGIIHRNKAIRVKSALGKHLSRLMTDKSNANETI